MIKIVRFYEDSTLADEPRWYVDEEDARRYSRQQFGAAGDAWAIIHGVEPLYSDATSFDRLMGTLRNPIGLADRWGLARLSVALFSYECVHRASSKNKSMQKS